MSGLAPHLLEAFVDDAGLFPPLFVAYGSCRTSEPIEVVDALGLLVPVGPETA